MSHLRTDFLIVGAGLAGCTLAERLARINKRVMVVERRSHIGGNAYDFLNGDGILVQKYGPHIFHTNTREVWDYLSRFTEWNSYVHRVLASVNGKQVHLPINLETMERLYDRPFTREEMSEFLEQRSIEFDAITNARDVVVSQVGEELYDLFFRNYTKKQWGVYPEELDPLVTRRLPVRLSRDTRYFSDDYQGIPKHGYTKMFEKMLDHPNIDLILNTDYKEVAGRIQFENLIFTGPIDSFFEEKFGKLPYRSLDFVFDTLNMERYQETAIVNYPNDHEYTRITEFKHFYFQNGPTTTICYEYPKSEGEPYYPIPKADCRALYQRYEKEATTLKNVYFIGRLAEYQYMDMDQVVEKALRLFEILAGRRETIPVI